MFARSKGWVRPIDRRPQIAEGQSRQALGNARSKNGIRGFIRVLSIPITRRAGSLGPILAPID